MNEQDGHMMLVSRMQALEKLLLDLMEVHNLDTGTSFFTEEQLKASMERSIERIAPGCSYPQ